MCVFFFQAEDGIRYVAVTGVQTCALPISFERAVLAQVDDGIRLPDVTQPAIQGMVVVGRRQVGLMVDGGRVHAVRSEERRVGKEGRGRWGTARCKKYQNR